MSSITISSKGEFSNVTRFLEKAKEKLHMKTIFDRYGEEGVKALSEATPIDSGETAAAWRYEVVDGDGGISITFHNDHVNKGVNIALILQYGHGTGTGGWVEGRDYINPVIQPLFDEMAERLWKEVTG
jgi:hypothetical protein